mgnify:CR=1 FL=1
MAEVLEHINIYNTNTVHDTKQTMHQNTQLINITVLIWASCRLTQNCHRVKDKK